MFEVLWKAGNKTWMSYEQVNKLNLLELYLELVGIEMISELIDGNGEPPHEDPQIYLGHLKSTHNISNEEGAQPVPSSSHISPPITTLSLCGINHPSMSGGDNNGHPNCHLFVTIDHGSKIIMIHNPQCDPSEAICIHPSQMCMLVSYDITACNANGNTQAMPTAPAGYNTSASLLNPAPQCPYRFAEFDHIECKYVNLDHPFPDNYFPTTFVDPQLDILVMLGFISIEGVVDRQAIKDSLCTLRAPSSSKVQATKNFLLCWSAHEQSCIQLPAPPTAKKRYCRAADHGSGEEEMASPPDKDQLSKCLQSLKGNSPPALATCITNGVPKPFTKDAIPTASKSVNTKVQDLKGKQKESITMEELKKEAQDVLGNNMEVNEEAPVPEPFNKVALTST
ncbi:hypothetical protein DXG01_001725 [Tephrocybe rancida]|nr:hypothetical protein DXG01_001725 [Tephrocybe rancida]